jgi:Putative zinc-finger
MKMFPKTQDHTIDRLLAAQGGAPGNVASLCSTFDADLASAYVERQLSASETAGYEVHLASCPPCRKTIIALTRLALAESAAARPEVGRGHAPALSPVRRWLATFATPPWAMAAAAAIVLAITLPLVLSHRAARDGQAASAPESLNSQATAKPPANESVQPAASGGTVAANHAASEARDAQGTPAVPSDKPAAVAAAKDVTGRATAPSGEAGGVAAASQPGAAKAADQPIAKNETPPAAPAAESPKREEKETKPIGDDRNAAKPATAQAARDEEAAKTKSAVAAETIAPPPPPPSRSRGGEYSRARRSDGISGPAASFHSLSREPRVPSRRVGNHQFSLRDGTWMDRDYDPSKDRPAVTVIRDSDVYRDLLAKEEKIKPFLTEFPADVRVIFVFKDKVYILIPQN